MHYSITFWLSVVLGTIFIASALWVFFKKRPPILSPNTVRGYLLFYFCALTLFAVDRIVLKPSTFTDISPTTINRIFTLLVIFLLVIFIKRFVTSTYYVLHFVDEKAVLNAIYSSVPENQIHYDKKQSRISFIDSPGAISISSSTANGRVVLKPDNQVSPSYLSTLIQSVDQYFKTNPPVVNYYQVAFCLFVGFGLYYLGFVVLRY
ncbi:hypothetical protein [Glaciecola sp. 1036]|uniref:hypothetical protein n=1 Tax=Alteromonadaceae TaxID=72275 RepID=UPI003CFDB68B